MNMQDLIKKIQLLEYHQKLMLEMLAPQTFPFNKLIIEKGLNEQKVTSFLGYCDKLSNQLEEQKAEGFVYYHPLFNEFIQALPANIQAKEAIDACLKQDLFVPLMREFKKYI